MKAGQSKPHLSGKLKQNMQARAQSEVDLTTSALRNFGAAVQATLQKEHNTIGAAIRNQTNITIASLKLARERNPERNGGTESQSELADHAKTQAPLHTRSPNSDRDRDRDLVELPIPIDYFGANTNGTDQQQSIDNDHPLREAICRARKKMDGIFGATNDATERLHQLATGTTRRTRQILERILKTATKIRNDLARASAPSRGAKSSATIRGRLLSDEGDATAQSRTVQPQKQRKGDELEM